MNSETATTAGTPPADVTAAAPHVARLYGEPERRGERF